MVTIENLHYIKNAALHLFKNPDFITIVPERIHISTLKNYILENCQGAIKMPTILSLEGLDISPVIENNIDDDEFLSRNCVFLWFLNALQNSNINVEDASVFARSIIGELPNLYANGINPDDILARIPVKISTEREVNLQIFVHFWKEFEAFLQKTGKKPYFARQKILLQKLLQTGRQFVIIGDFSRSPILHWFVSQLKLQPEESFLFSFAGQFQKQTFCIQNQGLEEEKIALAIQVASQISPHTTPSTHKIGIIAENEQHARRIATYLHSKGIVCSGNVPTVAESNPLIRAFLVLLGKYSLGEIVPLLNFHEPDKKHIFAEIQNNTPSHYQFIKEAKTLIAKQNPIQILLFVKENITNLVHSKENATEFFQFSAFLMSEIQTAQILETSKLNKLENPSKDFILHIATSWKGEVQSAPTNIKICALRHAGVQNFDTIILTSSYKSVPSSNVIFSAGMRLFYGFDTKNDIETIINSISCNIITTENIIEIKNSTPILIQNKQETQTIYKVPYFTPIVDTNNPITEISATYLETLLQNPALFYYKHIKNLKEFPYNQSMPLQIGILVHKILEEYPKIPNQNAPEFIKNTFNKAGLLHLLVFFYNDILAICNEISSTNNTIETEKEFSFVLTVDGTPFNLKSKADMVSFGEKITIYDYKTGKSKNCIKDISSYKKIQLTIVAMALQNLQKNMLGKYVFIGEGITIPHKFIPKYLDGFTSLVGTALKEYFLQNKPFEFGKEFYSHKHVARV